MKPFVEFPKETAQQLRYLLCDIDDTITTDGKLTAQAYQSLWDACEAGISVIPVTGRPAGWCDLIIRQWPVAAVVGENGAFAYYFKDQQLQTYTHPSVRPDQKEQLDTICSAVLEKFPLARVSKDQFARIYDLAIDFREDPPDLGFEVADAIQQYCESLGAVAKVSSIHVNTWFGSYDKVSMAQLLLGTVFGDSGYLAHSIFFGDSPNDEPMFAHFPNSCAVANIKPFLPSLTVLPAYITPESSGVGFSGAVKKILELRK